MTDREKFERWAETQPPYTTHDRAFAWSVWQAARGDLRAQQAALPEPALRLPARAGGYCGYFTAKQVRAYAAEETRAAIEAQQAEPPRTLTDAEIDAVPFWGFSAADHGLSESEALREFARAVLAAAGAKP